MKKQLDKSVIKIIIVATHTHTHTHTHNHNNKKRQYQPPFTPPFIHPQSNSQGIGTANCYCKDLHHRGGMES